MAVQAKWTTAPLPYRSANQVNTKSWCCRCGCSTNKQSSFTGASTGPTQHQTTTKITSNEPFSEGVSFADLENVDGFGEVSGAVRAAAEFAEDPPVFELGVRSLAGTAQLGV